MAQPQKTTAKIGSDKKVQTHKKVVRHFFHVLKANGAYALKNKYIVEG